MDIQNRITGEVYFVTDTVVDWVDIFTRPIYRHVKPPSSRICPLLNEKMALPVAGICNPSFLYYKDLQSASIKYSTIFTIFAYLKFIGKWI